MSTPTSPRPDSRPRQDFDLDVRVTPIAGRYPREEEQRATEITCVSGCTGNDFSCHCG